MGLLSLDVLHDLAKQVDLGDGLVNGEEQGEQGGSKAENKDGLCRYRHIRHVAVDRKDKDELNGDGDGGLRGFDVRAQPVEKKIRIAASCKGKLRVLPGQEAVKGRFEQGQDADGAVGGHVLQVVQLVEHVEVVGRVLRVATERVLKVKGRHHMRDSQQNHQDAASRVEQNVAIRKKHDDEQHLACEGNASRNEAKEKLNRRYLHHLGVVFAQAEKVRRI